MPQPIKHTPSWPMAVIGAALRFPYTGAHYFFFGLRYRLRGWGAKPSRRLPPQVASKIFSGHYDENGNFKNLSFTFAVIALSAKVACADGALTREKYIAFRDSFPLKGSICGRIRSLFTLACRNETPSEHYVTQIKAMFPGRPELFVSLVERLFHIAAADGTLSHNAEQLIAAIARGLEVSAGDYSALCNRYDRPSVAASKHAHTIMGVNGNVKAGTLKKRYHELMRSYHPDRFSGYDLSPEVRLLLQLKASEINRAYRVLSGR